MTTSLPLSLSFKSSLHHESPGTNEGRIPGKSEGRLSAKEDARQCLEICGSGHLEITLVGTVFPHPVFVDMSHWATFKLTPVLTCMHFLLWWKISSRIRT